MVVAGRTTSDALPQAIVQALRRSSNPHARLLLSHAYARQLFFLLPQCVLGTIAAASCCLGEDTSSAHHALEVFHIDRAETTTCRFADHVFQNILWYILSKFLRNAA